MVNNGNFFHEPVTPQNVPNGSLLYFRGRPTEERYMQWSTDGSYELYDKNGKRTYSALSSLPFRNPYVLVRKGASAAPSCSKDRRLLLL
jgi:hypothetical protein